MVRWGGVGKDRGVPRRNDMYDVHVHMVIS